jgi:methylglyoxal synthase
MSQADTTCRNIAAGRQFTRRAVVATRRRAVQNRSCHGEVFGMAEQGARIALVAHDRLKPDMALWVARHRDALARCTIVSTATTGAMVLRECPDISMRRVLSGPLGGDQQIGALIAEGRIDALFFFVDPMTPMPHDVDVKALLRVALVHDVACAFSARSADLLVAGGALLPGHRALDVAAPGAVAENDIG